MSTGNKVRLRSSDYKIFEVDKSVAYESQTLRLMLESADETSCMTLTPIPLPTVSGKTLRKVIEYCKYHVQGKKWPDVETPVTIEQWDANFMRVDQATLYDIMNAANYLAIKPLLNLTCQTLADMMRYLSAEEMRTVFSIRNDMNPEEEQEANKDIQWAFD